MANPIMVDHLKEAEEEYPAEWISTAFEEASKANARNWNYVKAILDRWTREGFQSDSRPKKKGKSKDTKEDRQAVYDEWIKQHEEAG